MSTIARIVTGAMIIILIIFLLALWSISIKPMPNETTIPTDSEIDISNPIEIIKQVSREKGIKPEHMFAISIQESAFGKLQSGDGGCSRGYFHINICPNANPDAKILIGDLRREAEWVADRLISYGYLEGKITLAFARYNSPAYPNYEYAELVKKRLSELDIYLKPYQSSQQDTVAG